MGRATARAALAVSALALVAFAPPNDGPAVPECRDGVCSLRMTAPRLLQEAEKLIVARRLEQARPMLAALAHAPELQMETRFLQGYVAAESGELEEATKWFRAVLRDRPDVTRARLELARVLMMRGKDSAADHHFRLAEQDKDLPPEIARTIRGARSILRDRKVWHLNVDVGFAPDSNINNATDSRTIHLDFGDGYKAYTLNPDARRKSGVGQTAAVSAGVRLRLSDGVAVVLDADGQLTNHEGKDADDVSALLAAGPELTMKNGTRVSIQAVGGQRWYGGKVAQRSYGGRLAVQKNLDHGQRVGAQIDVRRLESGYSSIYDGWQTAAYGTYERVVNRSMVASASIFARREDLVAEPFSSTEFGASIGIGGELPLGLNAGVSAGISRALFDAPVTYMSPDSRKEWRLNGRAYLGARSLRLFGFSPSVTYTYNHADSNVALYDTSRHRVAFGLARYF